MLPWLLLWLASQFPVTLVVLLEVVVDVVVTAGGGGSSGSHGGTGYAARLCGLGVVWLEPMPHRYQLSADMSYPISSNNVSPGFHEVW